MSTVGMVVAVLACVVASSLAGLRWLRVAQREHYLAGSTSRFAARWWSIRPSSIAVLVIGVAGLIASPWIPLASLGAAIAVGIGPIGLPIRGRTSPLAWTRRLTTLAVVSFGCWLVVLVVAIVVGVPATGAAVACLLVPALIDVGLALVSPFEERASRRFVEQAATRLMQVAPTVVGITGSYGKTSTKNHLAALIGTDRAVVPSPRSFNNRAGLARAINEHLAPGTDVFIAEMGTYGPGEIADMCRWCTPSIAIITAIGPVHLERFGSLDVTTTSKAEITEGASTVILNVDDDRLRALGVALARPQRRVVRVSGRDPSADVAIIAADDGWQIWVDGTMLATSPVLTGVQPTNAACALGAAIAVGVDATTAARRVVTLTNAENRLAVVRAPSGVMVVDDTFNSNPAGAAAALAVLRGLDIPGRRVLVTPGMIELGRDQAAENQRFAADAALLCDTIVIVGLTNRRSLRAGARSTNGAEVIEVDHRESAVAWVRAALGPGDAVLYENDLPDNYP
jgi:UDP-N-acetylmuramoyl-tripeptide--D-alanyl-D-alanine ligase